MILKKLNVTLKTRNVPVPMIQDDAEIIVSELSVRDGMRLRELLNKLSNKEDYGQIMVCCLMCAMKTPEGGYLINGDAEPSDIAASLPKSALDVLYMAYNDLNPQKENETLEAKKKKS